MLRTILVLIALAVAVPVRADDDRQESGRFHLALDASLFTYRRIAAEPLGRVTRPGQDLAQFGYADGIGFRFGYLWSRGWELGGLIDLGGFKSTAGSLSESSGLRFSPLAYVRYLFGRGSTRLFVGAVFGAELSRYHTRSAQQDSPIDPDQTSRTRTVAFGPEGGVRVLATDWLSIDPFLRWQVNLGHTSYSAFSDEFAQRSWRLLIGFAASFWL